MLNINGSEIKSVDSNLTTRLQVLNSVVTKLKHERTFSYTNCLSAFQLVADNVHCYESLVFLDTCTEDIVELLLMQRPLHDNEDESFTFVTKILERIVLAVVNDVRENGRLNNVKSLVSIFDRNQWIYSNHWHWPKSNGRKNENAAKDLGTRDLRKLFIEIFSENGGWKAFSQILNGKAKVSSIASAVNVQNQNSEAQFLLWDNLLANPAIATDKTIFDGHLNTLGDVSHLMSEELSLMLQLVAVVFQGMHGESSEDKSKGRPNEDIVAKDELKEIAKLVTRNLFCMSDRLTKMQSKESIESIILSLYAILENELSDIYVPLIKKFPFCLETLKGLLEIHVMSQENVVPLRRPLEELGVDKQERERQTEERDEMRAKLVALQDQLNSLVEEFSKSSASISMNSSNKRKKSRFDVAPGNS